MKGQWPDEDALSSNVVSPKESLVKGQWCKIKERRKMYDGKIVVCSQRENNLLSRLVVSTDLESYLSCIIGITKLSLELENHLKNHLI